MARFFYVDPSGNDNNPGTTPLSAWRTVNKVNAICAIGGLAQGDTVLFKRGATFYGKLRPTLGLSFSTPGRLTFGAYGAGAKPILSSYKNILSSAWVNYSTNVWKADLSASAFNVSYTGYDDALGGGSNVGHLRLTSGAVYASRVWDLSNLTSQWDFYCDSQYVYVRSSANPSTLSAVVEAAIPPAMCTVQRCVDIENIHFTGGGGNGWGTLSTGQTGRVSLRNCEISYVGGSQLYGTTRYGNGAQVWSNTSDVIISQNKVHDVYDTAFTAQGPNGALNEGWLNVSFDRNFTYRCGQAIEFWSASTGLGFQNVVFERNLCIFSGYGFGGKYRPDQWARVHLLTYGWTQPADIKVRNNIFWDAAGAYRKSDTFYGTAGMVCTGNLIALRPTTKMMYDSSETIEQARSWTRSENNDIFSHFLVLSSGLTTDPTDADVAAVRSDIGNVFYGGAVSSIESLTPRRTPLTSVVPA